MQPVLVKLVGSAARSFYGCAAICFAIFLSAALSAAQDDDTIEGAPPPELVMSRAERQQLVGSKDLKSRVRLALQLMESRLKAAEQFSGNANFEAVFSELGPFHALASDTIQHLERQDSRTKGVLDNLKRFELGIRGFIPRIELIRRNAPTEYEPYLRRLIRFIREARSRALDPMLSDGVIPIRRPDENF